MIKFKNKRKFFLIFIFTLSLIIFPVHRKLINKLMKEFSIIRIKTSKNCDFDLIKNIPKGSSIIVGHAYGSPISHNGFISKNLESFIRQNKEQIEIIFLTGDVFHSPTEENWNELYDLIGRNIKLIVAPGNHDVGSINSREIFNKSIKHSLNFPFSIEFKNRNIFIEDSVLNKWIISSDLKKKLKENHKKLPTILLRHNVPSKEFINIANSKYGLEKKLPSFKDLSDQLKSETIIVSGDGGAFNYLPRFFCYKKNNLTFILNGLGGLNGDIILVLIDNDIYKHKLN